jgi:hypothetical protein
MAGAAEQISQIQTYQPPLVLLEAVEAYWSPITQFVPELAADVFARHQADRFIGRIALGPTVTTTPETAGQFGSLHEALPRAYTGDEIARQLITTNVRTDVIERTIKAGHIMTVDLEVDGNGKIWQHGQAMNSIQANTLAYASDQPTMRQRSEAEVRNSFRIENLLRQGLLEDNYFVVFSRAADDMTLDEMTDVGFFTDTMSCAIQLTTASTTGLSMESAFVAGVTGPGQDRHDQLTLAGVIKGLGLDIDSISATELLDMPLLIPKSLLPNGVIDLVQKYDMAAGGTFFGEAKPQQDYQTYGATCAAREASFAPKVAAIVADLIAEAPLITSPVLATQRLHKLSQKYMVEQAVVDNSINPLVFGGVAAAHIEQARSYQASGQTDQAQSATAKAQKTARSSSCPNAVTMSPEEMAEATSPEGAGSKSSGGKKERMTCPFCHDPNQSGDPCSPNQHCNNCNATVKGGKVTNRGNGGKKAKPASPAPAQKEALPKLADVIMLEEKRRDQLERAANHLEPVSTVRPQPELHLGKLAVAS